MKTTTPSKYTACIVAIVPLLMSNFARCEVVREELNGVDGYNEVIRMTVTPADEPVPAFKYRLTLRPHEMVPGNSVANYMRAFPEGGIERQWKYVRETFGDDVDEWNRGAMPLSEVPLDKLRKAAGQFNSLVENFVGPGSRCRDTDWGVAFEDLKGPEIISFLLPEIQAMREVARGVSLQTRLAIAEHRYDDAIDLMRMNYRLGRDVGQQPILVSGLVGIAICGVTDATAVELIAAPNSPNMYWALSELPRPIVSLREALRLELAIGPRMFECLDDPENKNLTHDEWNALWKRSARLSEEIISSGIPNNSTVMDFQPLAFGMLGYSHACERLVAWGYSKEKVDDMAVGQVLSIYSARAYQIIASEMEKVAYVDYTDTPKLEAQADSVIDRHQWMGDDPDRELIPIAGMLLPAVTAVQRAGARAERNIDALRVIEALRMHAAQNDGEWPKSLSDITCVPVPNNAATGEAFEYHLDGDTAVLELPMSDGFNYAIRYELTIATDQPTTKAEGN